MSYLMSISIGPVQDFIATARRTRDLWFGSWLLSELARVAADKIVAQNKKESLIFPYVDDPSELQSDDFSAPNKILVIVDNPAQIASEIETAITTRLKEIWEEACRQITGKFNKETAWQQICDITEIYWAAVQYFEHQDDYKMARCKVEYLLGARKATRNFNKVSWGGDSPKSSLDGMRESVIPEENYRDLTESELREKYGVRQYERLCGVGLLKRHGGADRRFSSTAHIAALPFLSKVEESGSYKDAVEKYLEILKGLKIEARDLNSTPRTHPVFANHDGRLLFEERLREVFPDEQEKQDNAKKALKEFRDRVFQKENFTPSPYYAVLLADGDSMGNAINEQKSPEEHQKLSKRLSAFAGSVKRIVDNEKEGSLIYAGGDDVLAMVPLHTILDCAKKLSDEFRENLQEFNYKTKEGRKVSPTLSVGIAVVHFMEPLQDALDLARKALMVAKSIDGKDALAITVNKRGGVPLTAKGKWGELDIRLRELMDFDKNKQVSHQAAYQLNDLSRRLEPKFAEFPNANEFAHINRAEAARILKRKLRDFESDVLLNKLVEDGVENFASELVIAKEFNVSNGGVS